MVMKARELFARNESRRLITDLDVRVRITIGHLTMAIDTSIACDRDTTPRLMACGAIGVEWLMTLKQGTGRIASTKRDQRGQYCQSYYAGYSQ